MTQSRNASRSAATHHAALQLIMRRCSSSRLTVIRDAPQHALTRFNNSTLGAELEDAAVQTRSPICKFAAANDGMPRLPLRCIGSCAKFRARNKDRAPEARESGRSSDRGVFAIEPAGMRLILPAVEAAAVHEGQPVSQTLGNPAKRPAGKKLLTPRQQTESSAWKRKFKNLAVVRKRETL
jgi:hypothetical protein